MIWNMFATSMYPQSASILQNSTGTNNRDLRSRFWSRFVNNKLLEVQRHSQTQKTYRSYLGYDFGEVCNVYSTFRAPYVRIGDFLLFLDTLNPELARYPTSKGWISELRQDFFIIFEVLKNSARDLSESHFLSLSDQYAQTCAPLKSVPPRTGLSKYSFGNYSVKEIIILSKFKVGDP